MPRLISLSLPSPPLQGIFQPVSNKQKKTTCMGEHYYLNLHSLGCSAFSVGTATKTSRIVSFAHKLHCSILLSVMHMYSKKGNVVERNKKTVERLDSSPNPWFVLLLYHTLSVTFSLHSSPMAVAIFNLQFLLCPPFLKQQSLQPWKSNIFLLHF